MLGCKLCIVDWQFAKIMLLIPVRAVMVWPVQKLVGFS